MINIYLDNASTTPVRQEVLSAMTPYFSGIFHNPNSLSSGGQKARDAIERSRKQIATILDVQPNEIYFTSGGSESNCWAIQGFVRYWEQEGYTPAVITSNVEHDSVLDCVNDLDCKHVILPVEHTGEISLEDLEKTIVRIQNENIPSSVILISIQTINNETGVMQPIAKIFEIAKSYGCVLHTDAVQCGLLDMPSNDADMISISGHKFGAPKGIGVLVNHQNDRNKRIKPLIYGTQESYMRGGTENVPYIVGLAKALELANNEAVSMREHYNRLNKRLEIELGNYGINHWANGIVEPDSKIISITIKHDVTANGLMYLLDASNVQVSAGSACNAHEEAPSHVLLAMGLSEKNALRTLRISYGRDTTEDNVSTFVRELSRSIKLLTNANKS